MDIQKLKQAISSQAQKDMKDASIMYLIDRLEKAESHLAEIAKQKPVAWAEKSQIEWLRNHRYVQADLFSEDRFDEIPLFTRAAPPAPVDLAALVPDECPAQLCEQIIDICDGVEMCDPAAQEVWKSCRTEMLRRIESSTKS